VHHNTQYKNQSAEERSHDTHRFVRQIRSATRRKYTAKEEIVAELSLDRHRLKKTSIPGLDEGGSSA
jgi:hypothetical protein